MSQIHIGQNNQGGGFNAEDKNLIEKFMELRDSFRKKGLFNEDDFPVSFIKAQPYLDFEKRN